VLLRRCVHSFAVAAATVWTLWGQTYAPSAQPPSVTPAHPAATALTRPKPGHIKRVDPTDTYFRIICVVPLVGTGKRLDPVRPDYVPVHQPGNAYHTGIISWTQVPSDDGKHAIVEMVAIDRSAFQAILADKRPDVLVFQHGKNTQAQMEAGIQQYKKGFSLATFPRAVAQ
jgi:hypothetical protein